MTVLLTSPNGSRIFENVTPERFTEVAASIAAFGNTAITLEVVEDAYEESATVTGILSEVR